MFLPKVPNITEESSRPLQFPTQLSVELETMFWIQFLISSGSFCHPFCLCLCCPLHFWAGRCPPNNHGDGGWQQAFWFDKCRAVNNCGEKKGAPLLEYVGPATNVIQSNCPFSVPFSHTYLSGHKFSTTMMQWKQTKQLFFFNKEAHSGVSPAQHKKLATGSSPGCGLWMIVRVQVQVPFRHGPSASSILPKSNLLPSLRAFVGNDPHGFLASNLRRAWNSVFYRIINFIKAILFFQLSLLQIHENYESANIMEKDNCLKNIREVNVSVKFILLLNAPLVFWRMSWDLSPDSWSCLSLRFGPSNWLVQSSHTRTCSGYMTISSARITLGHFGGLMVLSGLGEFITLYWGRMRATRWNRTRW